MNVGIRVIYGLWTPKTFANFNKCQHTELLYRKKGNPEYIWLRTEQSLKKNEI